MFDFLGAFRKQIQSTNNVQVTKTSDVVTNRSQRPLTSSRKWLTKTSDLLSQMGHKDLWSSDVITKTGIIKWLFKFVMRKLSKFSSFYNLYIPALILWQSAQNVTHPANIDTSPALNKILHILHITIHILQHETKNLQF